MEIILDQHMYIWILIIALVAYGEFERRRGVAKFAEIFRRVAKERNLNLIESPASGIRTRIGMGHLSRILIGEKDGNHFRISVHPRRAWFWLMGVRAPSDEPLPDLDIDVTSGPFGSRGMRVVKRVWSPTYDEVNAFVGDVIADVSKR